MKNISLFSPVNGGRASEEVTLQIEAAIIDGRITPGDCLPSERDLQTQFGTGRGVVREALKALKQKGLVEIKKGAKGGAYVKQVEVANVSESLSLFLRQQRIAPDHLIEFRESTDRTITSLAIVHGTEAQKTELANLVARLDSFIGQTEPDLESLGEIDRELNILLARMTGNPIFEWIMQAIQTGFSSHDFSLYTNPAYREATIANWQETVREIIASQPQRALSLISHHYYLLRRCLADAEQEKTAAEIRS